MGRFLVCLCLQRILLPIALIIGCVLRQNGLSFVYLLLLLYNPIAPVATVETIKGHTGRYLKSVLFFTVVNAIAQFAFQIVLLSYPPYGSIVYPNCSEMERFCRYAGLVQLMDIRPLDAIRILTPEVLMLSVSILVLVICRALNRRHRLEDDQLLPVIASPTSDTDQITERRKYSLLTILGKYLVLASLCLAGILRPSVLSGVYFAVFLLTMTWWAFNKDLGKKFAVVCRLLSLPVAGHIITLYLYQMQWFQEFLPRDAPIARYLGLTALQTTECVDPRSGHVSDEEWASFVSPIALVWLYFMLWYESSMLFSTPAGNTDDGMARQLSARLSQKRLLRNQTSRWRSATRKVRLIRGRESVYRKGASRTRGLFQDSLGSVTIADSGEEHIKLENVPEGDEADMEDDSQPGVLEMILNGVIAVAQLIAQSSYIGTNIIMMAWSITYHSWLTFVLLLWAMFMWMLPNQRKTMLRTSPFLVLYAEFLLVAQYLYGMNLTDDELPTKIQGLNLKQIGFEKYLHLPVKPLLVKTLYTLMFWITLRQHNQEKWEARQSSAITDMVAPLQLGVGTATTAMGAESQTKTNQFVQRTGRVVRGFLTKYWIWVVAGILFTIGITGQRMTVFRIIYMALALVFILTFQLSWVLWRKIMYGFWLTVIIYSMLILVMTYTYQFDNFSSYWKTIGIDEELQLDIGLERFDTTELFVRLLTPTFFVVITVIQLYYFHKDFLAISDIKSRGTSSVRPQSEGPSDTTSVPKSEMSIPMSPTERDPDMDSPQTRQSKKSFHILANLTHLKLHFVGTQVLTSLTQLIEYIWLYLELHMLKIIMLSVMLLSVYDVCALHFVFVLLAVVSLTFGSNIQTVVTHIISVLVSILLLSKMIYQIEYIKHENWQVNCSETNTTYNTAEWVGFRKADNENGISLPYLLHGYIALIMVLTLHTVVTTRQKYQRHLRGRPLSRPVVMFPRVTYKELDADVTHCIKYLLNFGFYRFGVEICLMAVVALIGARMDLYALFYSLWLCMLITPRRYLLSKIWTVFKVFIVFTIPLQYAFVVGLPPILCVVYPWDDTEILLGIQEWMFLPDPIHPPPAYKLMCDFVLLLLVCRQALVFRIEQRHDGHEYAGGTNKSIIDKVEKPGFVNPIPDFISHARSWLDIFKRIVLTSFIWFTLAIVFLAGTNRVNLFSLGYFIGAFIFLWQGNDLYLRPIKVILRWWSFLIRYSVTVILVKAMLQILGCIFIREMQEHACWAIQLFGIACIKKFGGTDTSSDQSECSVPVSDVGLAWDGFCFGFLILQRRLFNSHYFLHIVDEAKAMAVLASRGAELIEELSHKQIQEQLEAERKILEKIKYKMDRIKASTERQKMPSQFTYKEPSSHFTGPGGPVLRQKRPDNSRAAIRSGDYYMFQDPDEELDLITEQEAESTSFDSEDDEEERSRGRGITVSKFLSSAMKTGDMGAAADMALTDEKRGRERGASLSPRPEGEELALLRQSGTDDEPSTWQSASSVHGTSSSPLPGPSTSGQVTEKSPVEKRKKDQDEKDGEKKKKRVSIVSSDSKDKESMSEKSEESLFNKIITFLKFLYAFVNSCMVTMTRYLNRFSRDYRYVMRTLAIEKKLLKERQGFGQGVRTGSSMMWQPKPGLYSVTTKSKTRLQCAALPLIRILAPSLERGLDSECSPLQIEEMEQEREMSAADQPPIIRLALAIWYAVISHSELVCYFMVFVHQMKSATLLSLPLPLMVFLWGTLTVPRPSKLFWVTIIAYTEVIVVIKSMFQFELLPWNQQVVADNVPFFPPRIIGIERKQDYASYDLLLLLIVFFHRSMLKSLGLWKTVEDVGKMPPEVTSTTESTTYSSSPTSPSDIHHKSDTHAVDNCEYFPGIIPLTAEKYLSPAKGFFMTLLMPSVRVTADVYAYMFFCDFFNFLVVIFGFASFGSQQGDGGVSQYFEENKVPIAFLVMLILQFALIIIDRTLYLRKFIGGKIIFQFILVIGIHAWMFFVLPAVTERQFNAALPPQMWYMVKCFYLLLSAYQIRSGYPTRILGNFLCKSFNYINMYLFKVFMAVPFVFELRALMDWIWTDTSMTLSDWLKMEDIFAHIFQLKCQRRAESEYPQPRGERKNPLSKYLVGGSALMAIIGVIWFPLVLFALGNTVGQPNIPYDVTIHVRIGAFQPIYSMSAQNNSIARLDEDMWTSMSQVYRKSRVAQTFLSNYNYEDVGVVQLSPHSTSTWTISPPDEENMKKEARSSNPITVKLTWTVSRHTNNPETPGVLTESQETILEANNTDRQTLVQMLNQTNVANHMVIPNLMPKFIKVSSTGIASPITQLMQGTGTRQQDQNRELITPYRDINMRLRYDNLSNVYWWELRENCNDSTYESVLKNLPWANCDNLIIYTFNDKAFPEGLNIISGKGLIGLYGLFIVFFSRTIRPLTRGIAFRIMFDDMDYVDRVLQLCVDIYLARESHDFVLEEDLFSKLIFLFRSPETIIMWTRPPDWSAPAAIEPSRRTTNRTLSRRETSM
ncbi:piezo-type mechanosensitive ion channel component isoform X3 [Macrosteles quadrilineatus]|uniref:piezo-type mechanosensitive ion channel component isoform X3 n=1 Tax=Macrosteles quadrilineatus TaxID=74068 RepID=UPI0023E28341|nr:piezo-type mechanosensitive ion channel component isoform X3 [Macrosteles quadrilineatus]